MVPYLVTTDRLLNTSRGFVSISWASHFFSEGSAATCFRCGWKCYARFVGNL